MAADSAATTYTVDGMKTFTVDKIFPLSFSQPIGVMFYNIADLTGFPLDVIVKEFSNGLGDKRYDTVEDYAKKFFEFINSGKIDPDDEEREIISKKARDKRIRVLFGILCGKIFDECSDIVDEKMNKGADPGVGAAEAMRDRCAKGVVSQTLKDMLKKLPATDEETIDRTIDGLEKIADLEEELEAIPDGPVRRSLKKQAKDIKKILANMLINDGFEDEYTGVVITGYGRNEFFPSYVHYKIYGYFFDGLKYEKVGESVSIDEDRPTRIELFAQGDVAESFIFGISKEFRGVLMDGFKKVLNSATETILDALDGKDSQKRRFIRENESLMSELIEGVENHLDEEYKDPVEMAIQFLSKGEIASLAESIIDITSLRRRVSMDPETVGGPTDVVIISRGEGFIWIKRKHYFSTELNPYYVERRAR